MRDSVREDSVSLVGVVQVEGLGLTVNAGTIQATCESERSGNAKGGYPTLLLASKESTSAAAQVWGPNLIHTRAINILEKSSQRSCSISNK